MRAHHLRTLALALGLVGATCSAALGAPSLVRSTTASQDPVRGAQPVEESALDYERVIALATPTARDLVHREVQWHGSVIDGVLAAQAADKPLLLWLYFGGPLGDC